MKRRDLEAHLRAHGCERLREGANHAIWNNPQRDIRTPIPRHREVPAGTARDLSPARDPCPSQPTLSAMTALLSARFESRGELRPADRRSADGGGAN